MPNNKMNDTIGRFLTNALPEQTRLSLELLAGLNFPLNDYAGLEQQIDDRQQDAQGDDAHKDAAENVLTNLTPLDFPIVTVQSVLEKFFYRPPLDDVSRFFHYWGPWPIRPKVGDETWRAYWRLIRSPQCVSVAFNEYKAALDSGNNEIDAFIIGLNAGKHCL